MNITRSHRLRSRDQGINQLRRVRWLRGFHSGRMQTNGNPFNQLPARGLEDGIVVLITWVYAPIMPQPLPADITLPNPESVDGPVDIPRAALRFALGFVVQARWGLIAGLVLICGVLSGESSTKVRVAAISFVPKKFDLQHNAKRLETLFIQAATNGAKIAVAPEGALEGYVVNEIIAGKAAEESMNDLAVPMDSKVIRRFRKLAREFDLCLVFGLAERIGKDVFNCAVFIDNTGKIAGKQHKMQFAEGYHPDWWFNRLAKNNRAFDTPYGRCGIMICNDRWNPQIARIPALDGAQFLVIPSFGSRSKAQDEAVLARGVENNLPVIEANVGVTLIVSENKIAAVDREEEGITYSDIKIPVRFEIKAAERDRVESEFMEWRKTEMQKRYERTMQRLKKRK